MGLKEELRQITLEEIKHMPSNYRCYEVAREIDTRLKSRGIDSSIKDGLVTYDASFLRSSFFSSSDFLQGLPEEAMNEFLLAKNAPRKIRVIHSWCEVDGQENGNVMVIDWHTGLRLSKNEILENILVVEDKIKLPHTYNRLGVQIGNWIIFRTFPPVVTKLRTQ